MCPRRGHPRGPGGSRGEVYHRHNHRAAAPAPTETARAFLSSLAVIPPLLKFHPEKASFRFMTECESHNASDTRLIQINIHTHVVLSPNGWCDLDPHRFLGAQGTHTTAWLTVMAMVNSIDFASSQRRYCTCTASAELEPENTR